MSYFSPTNRRLLSDFFIFLGATILMMLVFELIWPNSVLSYLNLNYIITPWFVLGLILLF